MFIIRKPPVGSRQQLIQEANAIHHSRACFGFTLCRLITRSFSKYKQPNNLAENVSIGHGVERVDTRRPTPTFARPLTSATYKRNMFWQPCCLYQLCHARSQMKEESMFARSIWIWRSSRVFGMRYMVSAFWTGGAHKLDGHAVPPALQSLQPAFTQLLRHRSAFYRFGNAHAPVLPRSTERDGGILVSRMSEKVQASPKQIEFGERSSVKVSLL